MRLLAPSTFTVSAASATAPSTHSSTGQAAWRSSPPPSRCGTRSVSAARSTRSTVVAR